MDFAERKVRGFRQKRLNRAWPKRIFDRPATTASVRSRDSATCSGANALPVLLAKRAMGVVSRGFRQGRRQAQRRNNAD